jgi:mobilization protein NikA
MEGKLSEIIKEIKSKKDKKPRSVNKGGRPKASLKRSNHLTVMCTIMEKKIIQMNAWKAGTNISVFLRTLGLNERVKVKTLPKEVLQLTGTLNHVAANLNQIARKRNGVDELDAMDRALLNQEVRSLQGLVKAVKTYLE